MLIQSTSTTMQAGLALGALLGYRNAVMQALLLATGVIIMPLINILRDGPTITSRWVAETALLVLATAEPSKAKAMADAGVMALPLELRIAFADVLPTSAAEVGMMGAKLGHKLLEAGSVAVRDLEQAIRSPDIVQPSGALVLLQVAPLSSFLDVCCVTASRNFLLSKQCKVLPAL
jgi:hypothetical protein